MARPLRIEFPGAFYHVIQRGIERKEIFISDNDKERFLSYLNLAYLSYKAVIHTYVLMNNHYHLILETPEANLSKIMHFINVSYVAYFNTRRKRRGPLYQGRFKAILVEADEYLHYLSCYIHLNPLRVNVVKHPEEYFYSSYRYFISNQKPPQWLDTRSILSMFNRSHLKAKRLYRQFVTDNIGKEKDIITKNTKKGFVLGSDNFFRFIEDKIFEMEEDPEIPTMKDIKRTKLLSLERIRAIVEKHVKYDKRLSRSLSVYLSRKYTQKTLNEIAIFYGKMGYTGVSQTWKRMEARKGRDKDMAGLLSKLEIDVLKSEK